MSLPAPWEFHAALSADRLRHISQLLLTELSGVEMLLSTEVDDGYDRGCTTFARQKNRIKLQARSGQIDWLTLASANNNMVFKIGGVPCRFSNDNPDDPTKDAVLVANRHQRSFFEETESGAPKRFCFVVDRGASENEDARVVFLGFDENNVLRCRWVSDSVRTLHQVSPIIPEATQLPKPVVGPKRQQKSDDTGT
jgi:hypothetical protein